ncbi:MAG: peptide ABC transporter substrate-binding protein [Bacteroidia bacterium]|nr:MAG: peptide ABC transporter substrate-binding protein [Bacteroidia bacterium]
MVRLLLFSVLIVSTLFYSCGKKEEKDTRPISSKSGGKIVIAEIAKPLSLFPQKLTRIEEALICNQIYEPLIRLNAKTLDLIPALAEKWEVSPDGKHITFYLRKGVRFQDDACFDGGKGREITTADVKFTFEKLCRESEDNFHFYTICSDRIVGAKEFNEAMQRYKEGDKKPEIKGLKIIDDYTFSIDLQYPNYHSFLQLLATPIAAIIPKEGYEKYKDKLDFGAGPYRIDKTSSNEQQLVLVKNPHYYAVDKEGYALPYIDTIVIRYFESTEDAIIAFLNHQVDVVNDVPNNAAKRVVEQHINSFQKVPPEYIIDMTSQMFVQYVLINTHLPPFDNIKVRNAVNYALDRNKIIEKAFNGQALPGIYGITPPAFKDYDITQLKGYDFNIQKAKELLAKAGYPNGQGFPTVTIYTNKGFSKTQAAINELQRQLKENLNINVIFESLPLDIKFRLEQKNKGHFFRQGWVADFPSPENFLSIFYGKHVTLDTNKVYFPNTQRYINPIFDEYYEKGRDAVNKDSAYKYFMQAEQILLDDAPMIVLWYEASYRLYHNKIKDFYMNPMRYYDLRIAYIEKNEK